MQIILSSIYSKNMFSAIALALLILANSARMIPGLRNIYDAIITFRYARVILARIRFGNNPGEHVIMNNNSTLVRNHSA